MTSRGKIEGLIRVPSGGWAVDAADSGGAFVAEEVDRHRAPVRKRGHRPR